MTIRTLLLLAIGGLAAAQAESDAGVPDSKPDRGHPATSLTAQAGDPTAPIVQFQITDFFSPSVRHGDGALNEFNLQPVIPIPASRRFPLEQILRVTIPYLTTPDPDGDSGLGDVSLVDLFVPEPHPQDVLGIGLTLTAPTAAHTSLGSGKWQLGPAMTWVYYGISGWQIGGILQNPISFAGDKDRDDVNTLLFQPIVNYLRGDWYFGAGDFNVSYDWRAGELTLPLAFQVGKIQTIGRHHYNLSFEAEWTTVVPEDQVFPRWGIRLGIVMMIPE